MTVTAARSRDGGAAVAVRLDGRTVPSREEIGNKAHSLARMRSVGLPVPPAFVLPTSVGSRYIAEGELPDEVWECALAALAELEAESGKRLGDPDAPLLLSVRSGAAESMPGMMDTVLDLGIDDRIEAGLARLSGDPVFARDSHRRFVESYARCVLGITPPTEADPMVLKACVAQQAGRPVPDDPREQLRTAIVAVLASWSSPRAIAYRDHYGIPHDGGTAVTVQAMAYGNLDDASGTGVLSQPLANGPSLPSTEQTIRNLERLGYSHRVDAGKLPPVARHCERIAHQEGWAVGEPVEYDAFAYSHHLPGGMTGTLKAQLAQYGMTDRFGEVLDETVRVRSELGHPISATPFSQLVGIQSVLNVVTGDRWSVVPDEVVLYLMNAFGVPEAPVDEDVRDRVLSSDQGKRFAGWERPQPSLEELRAQYGGSSVSDEELLLRYMVPAAAVDAARAEPVLDHYPYRDETTELDLVTHLMANRRARHVHVSRGATSVTMTRTTTPTGAARNG